MKTQNQTSSRRRTNRRWPWLVIFISVSTLIMVYPWARLDYLMGPTWQPNRLLYLVLFALPLLFRLSRHRLPRLISRWFSLACMTWLGISFIAFSCMVVFEILYLVLPLSPLGSAWVLLGITTLSSLIAALNAQLVRTKVISLSSPRLSHDVNLVQLSDVHIGSRFPGLLRRLVRKTNALKPDYVMITGDLIDLPHISIDDLQPLSQLEAPVYYVIGNHERYIDLDDIDARLRKLGLIVLRNETQTTGSMQIIGIDDDEHREQVQTQLSRLALAPEAFKILLYHRPDGLEAAAACDIDLMLTGHTHAGQIFPFNFIVKRVFPHIRGLTKYGPTTLYVSSGTGTWGPTMRLGSRSEMTHVKLSRSA